MMTYTEWTQQYPAAAAELLTIFKVNSTLPVFQKERSEARVQQQVRFEVAKFGAYAWRNNVGATATQCYSCGIKHHPIRYGLANDSTILNQQIKSSDLILAIPRIITETMVGETIAQFGSVECKRSDWKYTGKGAEIGQAAWLTLIKSIGGFATFSTGDLEL